MQALLKQIRKCLGMTQVEFAKQIQVTFVTANRWENGRATPNLVAQIRIHQLCCEKSVAVYEMILQKIADTVAQIALEPNRTLLYHGSKAGLEDPVLPAGHEEFGRGFCMETEPDQALMLCDCEQSRFYIVSIDTTKLTQQDVTDIALVNSLSAFRLGQQYAVVSQKCCDAVRVEAEIPLSYLEKLFIQAAAKKNREQDPSLAD